MGVGWRRKERAGEAEGEQRTEEREGEGETKGRKRENVEGAEKERLRSRDTE